MTVSTLHPQFFTSWFLGFFPLRFRHHSNVFSPRIILTTFIKDPPFPPVSGRLAWFVSLNHVQAWVGGGLPCCSYPAALLTVHITLSHWLWHCIGNLRLSWVGLFTLWQNLQIKGSLTKACWIFILLLLTNAIFFLSCLSNLNISIFFGLIHGSHIAWEPRQKHMMSSMLYYITLHALSGDITWWV